MTLIVKVSTSGPPELAPLLLRQTPSRSGAWGHCEFIVNQPADRCDWWFVCHYSGLEKAEKTLCDPGHLVYISMEPNERGIPRDFFKQFSTLMLVDKNVEHDNIIRQNGVTWWAGINVRFENGHKFMPEIIEDYDSFLHMKPPRKTKLMSVITSTKVSFEGHRKRLEFIERLRKLPISKYIDFFGGGHNPILDKLVGIAPYKYHLVLENSIVRNYWSEKLGDAFLGYSLPIYHGCPNINDYFPSESVVPINVNDVDESIGIIERVFSQDIYESRLPTIISARNMVINDYNLFDIMSRISNEPARNYRKCTLFPFFHFKRSFVKKTFHNLRAHFL